MPGASRPRCGNATSCRASGPRRGSSWWSWIRSRPTAGSISTWARAAVDSVATRASRAARRLLAPLRPGRLTRKPTPRARARRRGSAARRHDRQESLVEVHMRIHEGGQHHPSAGVERSPRAVAIPRRLDGRRPDRRQHEVDNPSGCSRVRAPRDALDQHDCSRRAADVPAQHVVQPVRAGPDSAKSRPRLAHRRAGGGRRRAAAQPGLDRVGHRAGPRAAPRPARPRGRRWRPARARRSRRRGPGRPPRRRVAIARASRAPNAAGPDRKRLAIMAIRVSSHIDDSRSWTSRRRRCPTGAPGRQQLGHRRDPDPHQQRRRSRSGPRRPRRRRAARSLAGGGEKAWATQVRSLTSRPTRTSRPAAAVQVEAVGLVGHVAGQVGVQPHVEPLRERATSRIRRLVAPKTECGPSATCSIARGERSW